MKIFLIVLLIVMLVIALVGVSASGLIIGVKAGEKEANEHQAAKRAAAHKKNYVAAEFPELAIALGDATLDKKRLSVEASLIQLHDIAIGDAEAAKALSRANNLYSGMLCGSLKSCRIVLTNGTDKQKEEAIRETSRLLDAINEAISNAVGQTVNTKLDDISGSAASAEAVHKL